VIAASNCGRRIELVSTSEQPEAIAIIGMSCRFPGARNLDEFWQNLANGVESVSFFSDEELLDANVDPAMLRHPQYVRARAILPEIEYFDAAFFGFTAKEAEITDPQHRIFLECAWTALEDAGCDPERYNGTIGIYAGTGVNGYLLNNLIANGRLPEGVGGFQILIGNDKDYLVSRVSYKLNLNGPSIAVQTACSTSLVAVHLASESLLNGECDTALAGGISIAVPQTTGYLYQAGGIASPDGHCRAFDASAEGAIFGAGAGVVVLKRLSDALDAGDQIYAVIKGSAVNNDGALKVGFTAPSVAGQAQVIAGALSIAQVDPATISYIEAHGTATPLGDPIEIAALTEVFRARTTACGFCAIGSVKTNVGHLDTAAGIAGLIKTALALQHRQIPPSLHFRTPNPKIDFAQSPFYVNTLLREWPAGATPRRAGISSFGIGGTNAHIIVEEAPPRPPPAPARSLLLLPLSARTPAALAVASAQLAEALAQLPAAALPEVAFTLARGRRAFPHRRVVLGSDAASVCAALRGDDPAQTLCGIAPASPPQVVFLLSGQGAQYAGMSAGLYAAEPVFRAAVDQCAAVLTPLLGRDIRAILYPPPTDDGRGPNDEPEPSSASHAVLAQTQYAQPALFVVAYALAQQWQAWGVRPDALIGHSLGEYVAATLAGVFALADALALVVTRGRLMQQAAPGAMLSVELSEAALATWLMETGLSVAAVNGPQQVVVSGAQAAVAALHTRLTAAGIGSRTLATTQAFHTPGLADAAAALAAQLRTLRLGAPQLPFVSNVSGSWITAAAATDPAYWARHMLAPVQFAAGLATVLGDAGVLLEVGPGQTLASLARRHPLRTPQQLVLASLRHAHDPRSDMTCLLSAAGQLWLAGVPIDWDGFYADERRQRLALPTYPFERQRYWIAAPRRSRSAAVEAAGTSKQPDIADWFYSPAWQRADLPVTPPDGVARRWLVFLDECGVGAALVERLERAGHTVVGLAAGARFAQTGDRAYVIDPRSGSDYISLLNALDARQLSPQVILHLWSATTPATDFAATQDLGFYSLLLLAQALGQPHRIAPLRIVVVTSDLCAVADDAAFDPAKATILGPCKVIPQEYPHIRCQVVDLAAAALAAPDAALIDQLLAECRAQSPDPLVAYRDARLVQTFTPIRLEHADEPPARLRRGGVYMIVGGLGQSGLLLAEYLARSVQATVVLISRSALPPRADWSAWLASHDEQDRTSRSIAGVYAIEAAGGRALAFSADIAELDAMRRVVAQVRAQCGAINGVIHAAGNGDLAFTTPIRDTGRAECAPIFEPKVAGLVVLETVLRGEKLDFCLLVSSLTAILGGLGSVAYTAANLFMDAFALKQRRADNRAWLSVNCDYWQYRRRQAGATSAAISALAMTAEEGQEAIRRVLALADAGQLIISTGELQPRIERYIALKPLPDADGPAISAPDRWAGSPARQPSADQLERTLAEIWRKVLGAADVDQHANFFDLGGTSLSALQIVAEIASVLHLQVTPINLFEAPTISTLARFIRALQRDAARLPIQPRRIERRSSQGDIAIIGMAGRFPGAQNVEQFWHNIMHGVESIHFFSDDELAKAGVAPAALADPRYVKARPVLDDVDRFDATFFGFNAREAEIMDPQHRLFLECAWEALEDAGYDAERYDGAIGVFGGSSISSYLFNLFSDPEIIKTAGAFQSQIGNERDYLTTVVSYKLNLTGPSVNVQTFCSTSLVATHMARQSLLNGECELALAGAASVNLPQEVGYFCAEGFSSDGHCRAFDADAQGMIMGSGVGVLVLKRLDAALADRDQIYAVIKGSAINNDGSLKAGYTAPSVDGQAKVIAEALASAGVAADEIGYIETHGSGTTLGDPIEVGALIKAFQATASDTRKQFCAIGSVKTNVGHADRAAGVAGLIKTALALKQRVLPPSLNFQRPNPQIDFANSPFYVNTQLVAWPAGATARRAGVTALGLGGTNAHIVLEEPPAVDEPSDAPSRPDYLLLLAAKTPAALDAATANLGAHLQAHPEQPLADVAYTLQVGRRELRCRRALVCHDRAEAIQLLTTPAAQRVLTNSVRASDPPVAFLFPGVGDHYVGMTRDLYQGEPVFRATVDRCAELLEPLLGLDLRAILYPAAPAAEQTNGIDLRQMLGRSAASPSSVVQQLNQTALSHPALFVVEYALAQLWMAWGVRPSALIGYSIGEYVAATLAGVFALDDALLLVARRAALIQALPSGAMLAVLLAEEALLPLLGPDLALAAVNGPALCVVAGSVEAVAGLAQRLDEQGVISKPVPTTHAFHSTMMQPLAEPFAALVQSVARYAPQIPYLSNVTGTWITADEVQNPDYWVRHMCLPVRFADGVAQLWQVPDQLLLEVGPGQALSSLALQSPACGPNADRLAVPSLRAAYDQQSDVALLLRTLGRLWLAGVQVDWPAFYANERRSRVALPTYPFERQRYWIDARPLPNGVAPKPAAAAKRAITEWFYAPVWKQALTPALARPDAADQPPCWLIFADACGVGERIVAHLKRTGQAVVCVTPGDDLRKIGAAAYTLNPGRRDEYQQLLREVGARKVARYALLHLWSVTPDEQGQSADERLRRADASFASLLFLAQALGNRREAVPVQLGIVSNNLYDVLGSEPLSPEKALILGPGRVIPQEYAQISCRSIDIELPTSAPQQDRLVALLLAEFGVPSSDLTPVAYRAGRRWVQSFEPLRLDADTAGPTPLRAGGVYLITGGLGGIGLALAEHLATTWRAKLVLVGRTALPPRATWPDWLAAEHDQPQVRERIEQLQALAAAGAELLVLAADVTDAQQLAAALAQVHERFGAINGVFHTAGVPGSGLVQVKTPDVAAAVLAPKVRGTLTLQAALRDDPLDFMVLFSSNIAVTGGLGQVDYCGANAFLDAFAQAHARGAGPAIITVDWGAWQWDGWQDALKALDAELQARLHERRQRYGIAFAEGMDALERILCGRLPQIVVSTTDFQVVLDQHTEFTRANLLVGLEQAAPRSRHPRPLLGTAYVAPRNDLEQQIATIMQLLLGIEPIGVHDSFFDLGGHSLLAIQLISRLRDCFQVDPPLQRVFEAANVANIAALVERMIVEEIEGLSETTAEQLLSGQRSV
jgi:acyl transferase domain-containing protein/acyl carrier protein